MKTKLRLIISLLFLFGFFVGCKKELKKEEQAENTTSKTIVTAGTRSGYIKPDDKYEFPDISGMSDWKRPGIIQERKEALQIPENVLANISTAGLLETCLEYPYLIDIHFFDDFQKGFNVLTAQFNGFNELLKRPDLVNVLLGKFYALTEDVKGMRLLESVERGRFSFRTFALEFMLAQDAVLEKLNAEQEKELFLLNFKHREIKNSYSGVFGNWHIVSSALLYAKTVMCDNAADSYANELSKFIESPLYIDPNTFKYLEDYINGKYK